MTIKAEDVGKDMKGKRRPRKRLRRLLLAALGLYMAAGYLTTAIRKVEVSEPTVPEFSLPTPARTLLSGVFSVHTQRSHDAQGTRSQVASAAVSAGLDFVVIGDHPPDDRRPDWEIWEPEFMDGVLVEGGLELRAPEAGKVLAMGVDTTYKQWEGNLGSFLGFLIERNVTSMVVHGRGPRESERWIHRRIGGVRGWEVLDISESGRARLRGPWSLYHLLTFIVGYPLGLADEALLHSMREGFDTPTIAAYDSLRQERLITATAGLNVHPKLSLGPILAPSYGPFFRTLVCNVAVAEPLPADPAFAEEVIEEGIRRGELFISLGLSEAARGFRLRAVLAEGYGAYMGADVPAQTGMVLRAGFEEDPGRKVVYRILRNGHEMEWVLGPELEWRPARSGVYRVEVYSYGARFGNTFFRLRPWIFANPIGLNGRRVRPTGRGVNPWPCRARRVPLDFCKRGLHGQEWSTACTEGQEARHEDSDASLYAEASGSTSSGSPIAPGVHNRTRPAEGLEEGSEEGEVGAGAQPPAGRSLAGSVCPLSLGLGQYQVGYEDLEGEGNLFREVKCQRPFRRFLLPARSSLPGSVGLFGGGSFQPYVGGPEELLQRSEGLGAGVGPEGSGPEAGGAEAVARPDQ